MENEIPLYGSRKNKILRDQNGVCIYFQESVSVVRNRAPHCYVDRIDTFQPIKRNHGLISSPT